MAVQYLLRSNFVGLSLARLKSSKKANLVQYLHRQMTDEFSKEARTHSYRARSAFKLIEINKRFEIIEPGSVVVDVGSAPGSWCQVLLEIIRPNENTGGYILGIDLKPMLPIKGVDLLGSSNITHMETHEAIRRRLTNREVDAVISDMAPNPTGDKQVDHARIIDLCRHVVHLFINDHSPVIPLRRGGSFLCKIWDGTERNAFVSELRQHFGHVRSIKPQASRDDSGELFILATAKK
ncbi:hypothetical protein AB6A40_010751 [Gnathostoma spinigerum]|uniref:rRNA methyltransferase 2, mitochondrial n=1 Tax=Gnathostoma spinigerum TaxID=75299 RepID=A0ABD6EY73_9BILA